MRVFLAPGKNVCTQWVSSSAQTAAGIAVLSDTLTIASTTRPSSFSKALWAPWLKAASRPAWRASW
ncbi:MAG: hypothetical protein M5U27_08700 [Gaiella sp.]|nr:hypothetical protein [Gaiella sp.]